MKKKSDTKNEIIDMYANYKVTIDGSSICNKELRELVYKIENHTPREIPDAFLCLNNFIYAIEHFQISQYQKKKKNQDISRISQGSKDRREKVKEDRDFDFKPSIDNLINALSRNLCVHSKSFNLYKRNILALPESAEKVYRLVIFVEDSTESGYIVKKGETKPINPLLLKQVSDVLLKYKDDIWGVIYAYGNECEKSMVAYTLEDLDLKREQGELLNASDYAPFEVERKVHISKKDKKEDSNMVTIRLCDHL